MNTPYINSSFLQGFRALVLAKGGNPVALCESVGFEKGLLIDEPLSSMHANKVDDGGTLSWLIPYEQFFQLLQTSADTLNFPDLAMQLAHRQDLMVLAPLGPMLSQCQTVEQVLNMIVKYLKVLVTGCQFDMHIQMDSVRLSFDVELPYIREMIQCQDYTLAITVSLLKGMMGKAFPIRACYFMQDEPDTQRIQAYARYFGCPVSFNCSSLTLVVDSSILQQDVSLLIQKINARINQVLSMHRDDFISLVTKVISFSLASGRCNIEDIASSMHYSRRTLQRKISEHNTSYRALLDSVRFSMANQYLQTTDYRITDIAVLLGYNNLSAFTRSYERWSGVTPVAARKQKRFVG